VLTLSIPDIDMYCSTYSLVGLSTCRAQGLIQNKEHKQPLARLCDLGHQPPRRLSQRPQCPAPDSKRQQRSQSPVRLAVGLMKPRCTGEKRKARWRSQLYPLPSTLLRETSSIYEVYWGTAAVLSRLLLSPFFLSAVSHTLPLYCINVHCSRFYCCCRLPVHSRPVF